MRKYSIVYKAKPSYSVSIVYLECCYPLKVTYNPFDAEIFDFISEASMLFELKEYRHYDDEHLDGEVMEKIETIEFKEIQ